MALSMSRSGRLRPRPSACPLNDAEVTSLDSDRATVTAGRNKRKPYTSSACGSTSTETAAPCDPDRRWSGGVAIAADLRSSLGRLMYRRIPRVHVYIRRPVLPCDFTDTHVRPICVSGRGVMPRGRRTTVCVISFCSPLSWPRAHSSRTFSRGCCGNASRGCGGNARWISPPFELFTAIARNSGVA